MLFAVCVLLLWTLVSSVRIFSAIRTAKSIVLETIPYRTIAETGRPRMLVLGDSTAYGVGARDVSLTTAGRVSKHFGMTVENNSVSGAITRGLKAQIERAKDVQYDLVLIQIGANDVIYFKSLDEAKRSLEENLNVLLKKTNRFVLLTSGNIGNAPVWLFPVDYLYERRTEYLRAHFKALVEEKGGVYIDLYNLPDPFQSDPERYYAPDGLHLSGDGYGIWAGYIIEATTARWKDLDKRVQ